MRVLLKAWRAVRADREWRIVAAIVLGLALAALVAVWFGGLPHMFTLGVGVSLGCIVQAVFMELQKRD